MSCKIQSSLGWKCHFIRDTVNVMYISYANMSLLSISEFRSFFFFKKESASEKSYLSSLLADNEGIQQSYINIQQHLLLLYLSEAWYVFWVIFPFTEFTWGTQKRGPWEIGALACAGRKEIGVSIMSFHISKQAVMRMREIDGEWEMGRKWQ